MIEWKEEKKNNRNDEEDKRLQNFYENDSISTY